MDLEGGFTDSTFMNRDFLNLLNTITGHLRGLNSQDDDATSEQQSPEGAAAMTSLPSESTPQPSQTHPIPVAANNDAVTELDGSPPLVSDSDSNASGHEDGAASDADTMPSLRSISADSSSEAALSSDESEWDDESEHDSEDESSNPIDRLLRRASTPYSTGTTGSGYEDTGSESEDADEADDAGVDNELFREFLERARLVVDEPGDLISMLLSQRSQPIDNDPKRAQTLLLGLEIVTSDLVRRYEKLRNGEGDDVDGCAICRDDLLEPPPAEGDPEATAALALMEALPYHVTPVSIIAFSCPGRHLFHDRCLAPWLARKTTCPTCRFDIDPDSLTLRRTSMLRENSETQRRQPLRKWEPPNVCSLSEWLEEEERVRKTGVRRVPLANTAERATVEHGRVVPADDEHEARQDEDDEDAWTDTDTSVMEEEIPVVASTPILLPTLGDIFAESGLWGPHNPRASVSHPLGHRAAARSSAAIGMSSMTLHDALREDLLLRGNPYWREAIRALQSQPPDSLAIPREGVGAVEDSEGRRETA
ncbi:hypothetical protein A0H81_11281 [Grifola frondosa]|uniref:RING-type domain-containing protein n=1 Tax=Grifola frondosa TaxID=5627 RepID=A0A1C7LVJ3_GRIFR|nr:hypothetical protein A0H81_11281 [Grifola frondosa]